MDAVTKSSLYENEKIMESSPQAVDLYVMLEERRQSYLSGEAKTLSAEEVRAKEIAEEVLYE